MTSLEEFKARLASDPDGALLGALVGSRVADDDYSAYRGAVVGAVSGLVATFLLSAQLDEVPGAADLVADSGWVPGAIPTIGQSGRPAVAWGLSRQFRF